MPFHLWPAQISVIWSCMTIRLILILKARQLGISWLTCGYALWLCLFQPGRTVLLFSRGQGDADELLRRIKVLYERLPDWLREDCPALIQANTSTLAWDNGSVVESLPASPGSGRSRTASLVILDEAAFLLFADSLYTALKPTIDGGGQLIILSTANGVGNLFHRLWTKASAGVNAFQSIFLPWWSRPGRDAAWYAAQLAEYTDPAMVHQEYPASPTEAFVSSGRTRFRSDWLTAQAPHVRPGIPHADVPAALRIPGLTIYSLPDPDLPDPDLPDPRRSYLLAGDVAEGVEDGDFDAAVLIDARSWEEIACLHGHWEPDEYAILLDQIARIYDADLVIERNNHGHAVLVTLKRLGTPRVVCGLDDRPGWHTTAQSKPQMIDLLAEALRDQLCAIHSQVALNELQIYRVLKNGATGAPSGYHDDLVMAWATALITARLQLTRPHPADLIAYL